MPCALTYAAAETPFVLALYNGAGLLLGVVSPDFGIGAWPSSLAAAASRAQALGGIVAVASSYCSWLRRGGAGLRARASALRPRRTPAQTCQ